MTDEAVELLSALVRRPSAERLLSRTTLRHLASAPVAELEQFVSRTEARRIHATFALARQATTLARLSQLEDAQQAFRFIYPLLAQRENERFVAVACDVRFRVLATEIVAQGSPVAVSVHIPDVFTAAMRHRAPFVLIAHSHPSDDPTPSPDDIALTRRCLEAGRLLGIGVLDHLVIAGDTFRSLRDVMPWDDTPAVGHLHESRCCEPSFVLSPA